MMELQTIGLIVPPAAGRVPADAKQIFPDVPFIAKGLGLQEMTLEGYESVIVAVQNAAIRLKEEGATAIALMGTSLSFYKGKGFNDAIVESIRQTTQLPVTTMSVAIIEALKMMGINHPAIASAYTPTVHNKLLTFLREEGIEPAGGAHLSISSIDEVHDVEENRVYDLGVAAATLSDNHDGILISCGGLATATAVVALEKKYGVPVISSPLAGLWAATRLVYPEKAGKHASQLFTRVPTS